MLPHPKQLLDAYGLTARKSLGQNFLFDAQILAKIAGIAALSSDSQVLEVGPGLGHLTAALAQRAARVVAVELDDRLLPVLRDNLAPFPHVELIHGDILALDPGAFFPNTPYHVVANVPYYITGAILRHLLEVAHPPDSLVLTVQKEVAERLTAKPGEMSLLAVNVQFYCQVSLEMVLKAGSFYPRPDVDSAVVRLVRRPPGAFPVSPQRFFQVVRAGFAQKRKQLQKNLRALGLPRPRIELALKDAGIVGSRRAETLSIPEWVALTQALFPADPS